MFTKPILFVLRVINEINGIHFGVQEGKYWMDCISQSFNCSHLDMPSSFPKRTTPTVKYVARLGRFRTPNICFTVFLLADTWYDFPFPQRIREKCKFSFFLFVSLAIPLQRAKNFLPRRTAVKYFPLPSQYSISFFICSSVPKALFFHSNSCLHTFLFLLFSIF